MFNLEKLAKEKWHYFHKRFRTPLYSDLLLSGLIKHYNQKTEFDYVTSDWLILDHNIGILSTQWNLLGERVKTALHRDPEFLIKMFQDLYEKDKKINQLILEINRQADLSCEKALQFFKQYVGLTYQFSGTINLPIFVESDLQDELLAAIRTKNLSSQVFQILTTPIKSSVVHDEEMDLLKLALKNEQRELNDQLVDDHLQKYAWLKNNAFDGEFFSKNDILKRIETISNPSDRFLELKRKARENKIKFRETKELFKDDHRVSNLIDTLQESIFFRSWRTERYYRNAYLLRSFYDQVAGFLKLSDAKDIFYLLTDEIVDLISRKKEVDMKIIRSRREGYLMYADRDGLEVLTGEQLEEAKRRISFVTEKENGAIRGMIAFPGLAKGPACIVLTKEELDKVKDGDILITGSTTPDYVPVLKRVKAIVTDEGGILSHASVISRELRIPCIIGTKTATNAFADGDHIEVNADKGTVKKL